MGAWQFRTFLIPKSQTIAWFGGIPANIAIDKDKDGFPAKTDHNLWENADALCIDYAMIGDIAPERNSWSVDARMFGAENGNDIQIWFKEGGQLKRVSISFSLVDFQIQFVEKCVHLAQKCECLFHCIESGNVIQPTVNELVEDMRLSKIWGYLADKGREPKFSE